MPTNPFEFVKAINEHRDIVGDDPDILKGYTPFLTNRAFSYHIDTLYDAQQMNLNSGASNRMQYDYYFHSVRRGKRFAKWVKAEEGPLLVSIQKHFQCGAREARMIRRILNDEQVEYLKKATE